MKANFILLSAKKFLTDWRTPDPHLTCTLELPKWPNALYCTQFVFTTFVKRITRFCQDVGAAAQHRDHIRPISCMEALRLFQQHMQNCHVHLSVFNLKHVEKAPDYFTFRERKKPKQTFPESYIGLKDNKNFKKTPVKLRCTITKLLFTM